MNKMFFLTILLALGFTSTNLYSQETDGAEPVKVEKKKRGVRFSTHKNKILERMRKRRAILDQTILCIENSKTKDELKACRKKMKESRQKKPKRRKKTKKE